MSNLFFHATWVDTSDFVASLHLRCDKICDIIDSGYVLSRQYLGDKVKDGNNIFNGNTFVSLTINDEPRHERFEMSSYDNYIVSSFCLIFSDLKGYYLTSGLDPDDLSPDDFRYFTRDNNVNRYSNFFDEVQVKDKVDLRDSKLVAIGMPISLMKDSGVEEETISELVDRVQGSLKKNGFDNVFIVDSTNSSFGKTEESLMENKVDVKSLKRKSST